MNLIVVESPAKAKALAGFLGDDYRVEATKGHIRDLPREKLGVDVEHDFAPTYWFHRGGRKLANRIRDAAREADAVYLATDPDREGEAIGWHVRETALDDATVHRITFHEITPEAVKRAVADPGGLDMDLVDAQQARRILDRLVGYEVSPVLWDAIQGREGLSAGRVQTVALRLLVERDREIEAFDPEEYWQVDVELSEITDKDARFLARLVAIDGDEPGLGSEEDAQAVVEAIETADFRVLDVRRKRKRRWPYPPYTTSTLQRDASHKLHWSASQTMRVAQQLYEGVDLPNEGTGDTSPTGLITYMRTDSTHVAESAQREARGVIARYWGDDYVPERPPRYETGSKVAQEAHEAIRPTSSERTPKAMREHLTSDQAKLYEWIWRRFVASQMRPAVYEETTVDVVSSRGGRDLPYLFRASGREMAFEGCLEVYPARWRGKSSRKVGKARQDLPELMTEEPLLLHEVLPEQHFTEPPSRYTEASLIKEVKRRGIGRPSTFAKIVGTLFKRKYVERKGKSIVATRLGLAVCDFLVERFPDLFEAGFTADMEEDLDQIARGERGWVEVLRDFYGPFQRAVEEAREAAQEETITVSRRRNEGEPTGEKCPDCGGEAVIRSGKYGKFKGCSNYPKCKWTAPLKGEKRRGKPTDEACPECGGAVVIRKGKYGCFRACSNYPECDWSAPQ